MTNTQRLYKRTFDISLAFIGTLISLFPICLVGIIVKMTSEGPAFFMQERVGRKGRIFKCIKIRTMQVNSERQGTVTTDGDYRITGMGRILRYYKIDELPQLWNILAGHMSFVGPRPDVPGYADHLVGENRRILELYPGITGPASLIFRREEAILAKMADPKRYNDEVIYPEKIRINLNYIDNWSFWKDIGYMLITICPTLSKKIGVSRWVGIGDFTATSIAEDRNVP